MIVSCPACDSRIRLSARETSGQVQANCRTCGHRWTEIETLPTMDLTIDATELPARNLPRVIDQDEAPEFEARRLGELAREAQSRFASAKTASLRKKQNWAAFCLFLLSPLAVAALMPETIVAAAPISIKAYEAMGYDINLYGLDIRQVQRQHAIIEGKRILSIKGEITNVDEGTRKIPWLRFALEGPTGEELYTWTLDTASRPLRPGETTGFVTRVAAPPEAAQNLKIRFARADEIAIAKAQINP